MEENTKGKKISRRAFIGGAVGAAGAVGAMTVLGGCATAGATGATGAARLTHNRNSPIFEPTRIGSLTLKNKMIRAAMAERRHGGHLDGPTPALARMWAEEAAGGIGMVMTGGIGVLQDDYVGDLFGGFTDASQTRAYRDAVDGVHRNGAKICAQIMLVGNPGTPFFVNDISVENIRRGVEAFARTAVLVRDAGFDAINFHFAHGYLGAQFWSHYRNTRTDQYGGSAQNRARFPFEIVEAARRALGSDFPLTAKINVNEHYLYPGSSQEETNYFVQGLADRGIDAVEISGAEANRYRIDMLSKEDHNYFSRLARLVARNVNVPMILTGGVRSVFMMEEALRFNSNLVAFGMARTILAEPDLPNIWQRDTTYDPKCITCNWCLNNLRTLDRMLCVLDQTRV